MRLLQYFLGFLAGTLLSAGYILGKKEGPKVDTAAIDLSYVENAVKKPLRIKAFKKKNPSAESIGFEVDEEAIVPDDREYNAREALFQKLREENKIEYIKYE